MNEYRVKVSVRNNLLLSAIEAAGFKTLTLFAEACECHQTQISQMISLKLAPICASTGEFRDTAKKMMEVLGACPTDLWTDRQLTMELLKNTGERAISENYFDSLIESSIVQMTLPDPSEALERKENETLIVEVLDSVLTPKQKKVVQLRFGIGCEEKTLSECGAIFDLTDKRIRQIEGHALNKIKWCNSNALNALLAQ